MQTAKKANTIIKSEASKEEKVRQLCELARDIAYKQIGFSVSDMLRKGKGSCTPKHIFLAKCLRRIKVPVKFLKIPFYYHKIKVKYPKQMLGLAKAMPIAHHTALKAKIKGKWVIIDITWDSQLKGFPVNKKINLASGMKLAVAPEKTMETKDPRKFRADKRHCTKKEREIKERFSKLFDKFLSESRK